MELKKASEVAAKLLEFYGGDKTKWTKGTYARDKDRAPVSLFNYHTDLTLNPLAHSFCLSAAWSLSKMPSTTFSACFGLGGFTDVITFNDSHTFEEVIAKLEEIADESK